MALMDDKTKLQIQAEFKNLAKPVTIHLFTQEVECHFCRENKMIAQELAEIVPDKIKLEIK